jgi:AmiR/NasT family two-component response regulator
MTLESMNVASLRSKISERDLCACASSERPDITHGEAILMERNGIDAEAAFALLKSHSQQTGQKLLDVAQAITQTHQLLPPARTADKGQSE